MKTPLILAAVLAAVGFGLQYAPRHVTRTVQASTGMETSSRPETDEAGCAGKFLGALPPTIPARQTKGTTSLCYRSFAVLHSSATRTPLWSAERLDAESVGEAGRTERVSEFEAERRIPEGRRAELPDYRGTGWDRGHLSPSGDMPGLEAQRESFTLANIVPQDPKLNRGPWKSLESDVRALARREPVYIVTGVTFDRFEKIKGRKGDVRNVYVPTAMWKAVAIPGKGSIVAVADNAPGAQVVTEPLEVFSARTGIDPFPAIDAADRRRSIEL